MIRLNYSVKISVAERGIPGINCGLISLSFYDYILIGEPHSASHHVIFYAIEFKKSWNFLKYLDFFKSKSSSLTFPQVDHDE